MSFASLLAGYAKAKSAPPKPVPARTEPAKHALFERLSSIRCESKPLLGNSDDTSTGKAVNLGILFIIIDEFPNELLWRLWLQQGNAETSTVTGTATEHSEHSTVDESITEQPAKVRVWFHAKNPDKVRSAWVRERLVKSFHFKPEWGSIDITKVMAHLLHEATHDAPHINKFCFASESCIPIVPLDTVLQRLYAPCGRQQAETGALPVDRTSTSSGAVSSASLVGVSDTAHAVVGVEGTLQTPGTAVLTTEQCLDYDSSWLSFTDTANNGYAYQLQFEPLKKALPVECIYKASQWLMLSRTHALAVLHLLQQLQEPHELQETQGQAASSQDNRRPAGPPKLCERIFSIFKDVRASDEMFFPCCLALLGYLSTSSNSVNSSSDAGAVPTATTTAGFTAACTTGTTAPATATRGSVLCQQVTYSDWTNNAKNPADYAAAFPAALAQALRTAHLHRSNSSNSGGSGSSSGGTAGKAQDHKRDSGSEININADQHHVVFMRKVKFPALLSSAKTSAASDSAGAVTNASIVLSEGQQKFLKDWLPFLLQPEPSSSCAEQHSVSDNDEISAWLQLATELLQHIHFSATTVVDRNNSSSGHGSSYSVHNVARSHVRGDRDISSTYSEYSNRGDQSYRNSDYSRNDDYRRGSDDRYDRHKRDRDQNSSYDYDNKRYRY